MTQQNPQTQDPPYPGARIGIAGGGLLGTLMAWQLAERGYRVTIFEAGSAERNLSAAHTAAGMLAPISEAAAAEPCVYTLGLHGIERWHQWLEQLGEGAKHCIHNKGSLLVAHPQDESELDQFMLDSRTLRGQPHARIEPLDGGDIQSLEPDLNPQLRRGIFLSPEAHLDNRQILARLDARLAALDVERIYNTQVVPRAKQILDTQSQTARPFCLVIDCRGAGARHCLHNLRGVRGETLHLETTEVSLSRPVRLMHPRYQLYVVPKPGNRYVIGATQIESEDLAPITLQSSLELSSAVYTLSPAFAEARILEAGVNLRPAFASNFPQLQCEPGLLRLNGLFRHGYLLAPALVDCALAQITGESESPHKRYFIEPKQALSLSRASV
ncbi:glycine oxidase ThiO [Gilvimarinus algae]|uniref:D-amino-acid oxidase n=1 Tax=Gilvimarinus algae TaxID=3058037 RepID=A0ABT8TEZ1_9GAMM|nr:glycine oxidase ThiO [Gilvimarinus sp. SDUM040014]MDO3382649.1 glycine oxidase ThiO [Gilvimarinus sp. SDUM040014]